MTDLNPTTNPDAQEALSKVFGNDIIILLPLKSGRYAVFNNARELCAVIDNPADCVTAWKPLTKKVDLLEELELL